MISAGRNSLLPSRADQASRCSSLVVGGWLRPMNPNPASPARPSTSRPLPKSPMQSPPSRLSAISPQKAALPKRLGLLAVERAQEREGGEHRPGEDVEPVERDHERPPPQPAVEQQQPEAVDDEGGRSRSGSPTTPARAGRGRSRRSPASAGSARSSRSRRRCPRRRTARHCRSRRHSLDLLGLVLGRARHAASPPRPAPSARPAAAPSAGGRRSNGARSRR